MNFETAILVAIILQVTVSIVPIISFYAVRELYKGVYFLIISILLQIVGAIMILIIGNSSLIFGLILPTVILIITNILSIRGFYKINSIKTPIYDNIIVVSALIVYIIFILFTKTNILTLSFIMDLVSIFINLKFIVTLLIIKRKINFKRMLPSFIVISGLLVVHLYNFIVAIGTLNGSIQQIDNNKSLIILGIQLALFLGFIQTNLFMIQRRSISSLKKQQEVLEFYANYDELTNLPNRRLLMDKFGLAVKNSKRFALAMFDLDDFKFINDNYGHEIGDAILKKIGERLSNEMTEDDFIARYGGDEFIMIIQDNKEQFQIEHRLKKIIKEIAKPITINKNKISVTISMGLSVYPKDGKTIGTLRKKADTAMYKVKYEEKNNFKFFVK